MVYPAGLYSNSGNIAFQVAQENPDQTSILFNDIVLKATQEAALELKSIITPIIFIAAGAIALTALAIYLLVNRSNPLSKEKQLSSSENVNGELVLPQVSRPVIYLRAGAFENSVRINPSMGLLAAAKHNFNNMEKNNG